MLLSNLLIRTNSTPRYRNISTNHPRSVLRQIPNPKGLIGYLNINIGKYFLHLLDKDFNTDNPLSKIFNRNTVKISYSCTNNMNNILNNHNRRLLNELIVKDRSPDVASCHCRSKEERLFGGRCNSRNVVYQACISPMEHKKTERESI